VKKRNREKITKIRFTDQGKTIVKGEENSQSCNSGSFKAEDGGVNLGSVDN
jgi:hypothetical protein